MNDAKVDSEDVKNGDTGLGEAIQSVRKPHLRQGRFNRFSVMGFLLPFQSLITSIVCHSPVNSRQVTIAWLIIKLIAYGFLLIGAPWAFVTGAFLIFVAIALDGSDGEIGRYKARAMTPASMLRDVARIGACRGVQASVKTEKTFALAFGHRPACRCPLNYGWNAWKGRFLNRKNLHPN